MSTLSTNIGSHKELESKFNIGQAVYWGSDEENDNCENFSLSTSNNKSKKLKKTIPVSQEKCDLNEFENQYQIDTKSEKKCSPISSNSKDKFKGKLNKEKKTGVKRHKLGKKCSETANDISRSIPNEEDSNSNKVSSSTPDGTTVDFCKIGQVERKKNIVKKVLPNWISNPSYFDLNLEEKIPVSEISYLSRNTKKNLKGSNFNYLFPVQASVIPFLIQNIECSPLIRPSDICVSAPTGSGKTLAYVLPIVESLKDRVICKIRAIVVLPVSELANQVYVFKTFTKGTSLKVTLLTGQKCFLAEENALVNCNHKNIRSLVDIVVTTPGRLYDHMYKTKGFCLKSARYLIIDEADRMIEEIQQGWLKQVETNIFGECHFDNCVCSNVKRLSLEPTSASNFVIAKMPLQKLLYSATLTHDIEQLHSLALFKPKLFTSTVSQGTLPLPDELTVFHVICENNVKPMVICHLINTYAFKRVLCFTETVERAHKLRLVLEEMGMFEVVREISSLNKAVQRKIILKQFASGKINILVCSDLVARGIDINGVDCVISYDVPQYVKLYIHRIGRTARAGKTGLAFTLLSDGEVPHFKRTLKSAGIKMPKRFHLKNDDIAPLTVLYQTALSSANAKLK